MEYFEMNIEKLYLKCTVDYRLEILNDKVLKYLPDCAISE